jgi:hypothetical protein
MMAIVDRTTSNLVSVQSLKQGTCCGSVAIVESTIDHVFSTAFRRRGVALVSEFDDGAEARQSPGNCSNIRSLFSFVSRGEERKTDDDTVDGTVATDCSDLREQLLFYSVFDGRKGEGNAQSVIEECNACSTLADVECEVMNDEKEESENVGVG